MKIYGKEHDYYDCVLAYGQDPLCVWHRKFENFVVRAKYCESNHSNFPVTFGRNGDLDDSLYITALTDVHFSTGFVLFCGRSIPFIKICYNAPNSSELPEIKYFYDSASIKKYLSTFLNERKLHDFLYKQKKTYLYIGTKHKTNIDKIEQFFKRELNKGKQEFLHQMDNIPVFIYCDGVIHTSGPLEKYEFQKVMDPFTCLQELNMYISGVLGGQSPKMIEISDVDKIEGKGFDKVTSFRNMKRD